MNDSNYLLVIILDILYSYLFLQFLHIAALCNYVIANQIKHGLLLLLHYFRNIKKTNKTTYLYFFFNKILL